MSKIPVVGSLVPERVTSEPLAVNAWSRHRNGLPSESCSVPVMWPPSTSTASTPVWSSPEASVTWSADASPSSSACSS